MLENKLTPFQKSELNFRLEIVIDNYEDYEEKEFSAEEIQSMVDRLNQNKSLDDFSQNELKFLLVDAESILEVAENNEDKEEKKEAKILIDKINRLLGIEKEKVFRISEPLYIEPNTNTFHYNDGGRSDAGYKGYTGDCVVRAIAIATEIDYQEVYDNVNLLSKKERITKRNKKKSNSRTGVGRRTYDKYLASLGYKWVACMSIGSGCKVHLKANELPMGRLIIRVTKHVTSMIDGIINDTYDPSRNGTRCVYGYFIKE